MEILFEGLRGIAGEKGEEKFTREQYGGIS